VNSTELNKFGVTGYFPERRTAPNNLTHYYGITHRKALTVTLYFVLMKILNYEY